MRLNDAARARGAAEDMDEEWETDGGVGTDLGTRHCVVGDNSLFILALSDAAATTFARCFGVGERQFGGWGVLGVFKGSVRRQ